MKQKTSNAQVAKWQAMPVIVTGTPSEEGIQALLDALADFHVQETEQLANTHVLGESVTGVLEEA